MATRAENMKARYAAEGDVHTWFPVSLYERKIVSPDPIRRYRYEAVDLKYNQMGASRGYPFNFPPAIGDWITTGVGTFRVIDRQWLTTGYGATYWPITEDQPIVPHSLVLIAERARPGEGPFAWEAELEQDEGVEDE